MHEAAGRGMGRDRPAKSRRGTETRGKKLLVDRLLLKREHTDANLGMGIEEAAAEKPFLMGVHIDEVPGSRCAQHVGHIAVEHPQVPVVTRPFTFGGQSDFRSRTGHKLCHGNGYVPYKLFDSTMVKWLTRVPEIIPRSNRTVGGQHADVTIAPVLDLP